MLKSLFRWYSAKARSRRGELLRERIVLSAEHRVLDLGGGDGTHFHSLFPDHRNVVVADILPSDLERARVQYGYKTVQLKEDIHLPFRDREFDFLFCSSVIEHITGQKSAVAWTLNGKLFEAQGRQSQWALASEIKRVARQYYVQTPYRYFLVESHSWLPGFIVFLPRPWLVALLKTTNRFWLKKTAPDWRLLTIREFRSMFTDAEVHLEHSLGVVKSLMAIKFK